VIQNNSTPNGKLLQMKFLKDPFWDLCFFLLYVIDLPNAISEISNPVLYADDTNLIITNTDSQMFEKDINTVILQLNRWFNSNLLISNLEKTYFLQFLTKNNRTIDLHISYENKQISNIHSTKFWGLVMDTNLSWHSPIDQMIPKLNKASYVIRALKSILSFKSLMMVYFSTVHSVIIQYNVLGHINLW
jgi:hypothetical protein